MSRDPATRPDVPPWLEGFETHDCRQIWKGKQAEDLAQKHIIRGWLPRADRCLELGGGFGRITRLLEQHYRDVVMLELSRRNLAMAKGRLQGACLARSDGAFIPARDSCFDCIVMVRVVHLLPDPRAVMQEVSRVARDGATVIITIPNMAMNNLIWAAKRVLLPAGLRNRTPSFGPAAWPFDERPYFVTPRDFAPRSLTLLGRRGTGAFDNALGRAFSGSRWLYLLDVATSPLWFLKPDIFLRFIVVK